MDEALVTSSPVPSGSNLGLLFQARFAGDGSIYLRRQ
jgi:hypothetical protein